MSNGREDPVVRRDRLGRDRSCEARRIEVFEMGIGPVRVERALEGGDEVGVAALVMLGRSTPVRSPAPRK